MYTGSISDQAGLKSGDFILEAGVLIWPSIEGGQWTRAVDLTGQG